MKKLLVFLSITAFSIPTLVKAENETQETKAAEIFKTAAFTIPASFFVPRMISNKIITNIGNFALELQKHGPTNLSPKQQSIVAKSILLKTGVALALRPVSYIAPAYLTYDTYKKLNYKNDDILLEQQNKKS